MVEEKSKIIHNWDEIIDEFHHLKDHIIVYWDNLKDLSLNNLNEGV